MSNVAKNSPGGDEIKLCTVARRHRLEMRLTCVSSVRTYLRDGVVVHNTLGYNRYLLRLMSRSKSDKA